MKDDHKGGAYVAVAGDGTKYGNEFNPWIDDWNEFETKGDFVIKPQPIFADIEFVYRNKKKYMVMGFWIEQVYKPGYRNYDTDAQVMKEEYYWKRFGKGVTREGDGFNKASYWNSWMGNLANFFGD